MGTMGTWGRRKNNQSTALILRPPQQASARKERMVGGRGLATEGEVEITWACTARWKAPRLKGSMEPLWFLVPSGKTQTRT